MPKTKAPIQKNFGRIAFFKKSGARLYIPQKTLSDPSFPFKNGDILKIEVNDGMMKLKTTEWWEMLDWKKMPEAFAKLPLEVQSNVKAAGLF